MNSTKVVTSCNAKRSLLAVVIATCVGTAQAAPAGGAVVGGEGVISQTGTTTIIDQGSQRLAIDWHSFNVGADELVRFQQPNAEALALNRVLSHDPSRIFGRIEANGRVILANPHGVFFGAGAKLDVGALVASGLAVDPIDFMNGDLLFSAVAGTNGTVVNRGLINAATGGSVALLGKSVTNRGFISADLGHVALAAGSQAVVTFDDSGLLGVSVDAATLAEDLNGTYATLNTGRIDAAGGKILLTASVAANLFSQAVNQGSYADARQAIVHDDGSFTLGSGRGVYNGGTLNVSNTDADAGQILLAGSLVNHNGRATANADAGHAGMVQLQASEQVRLGRTSDITAVGNAVGGRVALNADQVIAAPGAAVTTSGYAALRGLSLLRTPTLSAQHALITSIDDVLQAGPMTLAGNLHMNLLSEANVRLTDRANDFATLSLATEYVSNVRLVDANDLQLGDITLGDSTLHVCALGDGGLISQLPGTRIGVYDSALTLMADHIELGAAGATTRAQNSLVELYFADSIATHNSLDLSGEFNFSWATIFGDNGTASLRLTGTPEIDLNAALFDDGDVAIVINSMRGQSAWLKAPFGAVEQTDALDIAGNLDLNFQAGGDIHLTNAANRINSLTATFGYTSNLYLHVENDVILRDLTLDDSSAYISAGGTVRQAAATAITGGDGALEITAESILLGAGGSSSINLSNIGVLRLNFNDRAVLNGPIQLGGYAAYLQITGSDNNNTLVVGEQADFAIDSEFFEHFVRLGGGDDRVILHHPLPASIYLGLGADQVRIMSPDLDYDLQDFNSSEDQRLVAGP